VSEVVLMSEDVDYRSIMHYLNDILLSVDILRNGVLGFIKHMFENVNDSEKLERAVEISKKLHLYVDMASLYLKKLNASLARAFNEVLGSGERKR